MNFIKLVVRGIDKRKHICYNHSTMLIETLKQIQARDNLNDQQFANALGIHRVSWQRIKNRRKPFGRHFLSCARKAFPELKDAIDIFLSQDVTSTGNSVVDVSPTPFQSPHNQNLRGLWGWVKELVGRVRNIHLFR